MKTALAYVLYWVGDWISRVMCYFDWAWLHPIYSRLMSWSINLDTKERVWHRE